MKTKPRKPNPPPAKMRDHEWATEYKRRFVTQEEIIAARKFFQDSYEVERRIILSRGW